MCLSRDVTESDFKQRRDIKSRTATYSDGAAVRAALLGRVLVLDGIEKAERNVLPVINNLLENREIALEDGPSGRRRRRRWQQRRTGVVRSYGLAP